MKSIITCAIFQVLVLGINAQSIIECDNYFDKWCLFLEKGKTGIADKKKIIVPPQYDSVWNMSNVSGRTDYFLAAYSNGNVTIYTSKLKVVPLKNKYSEIRLAEDFMGSLEQHLLLVKGEEEFIYMDESRFFLRGTVTVNDRIRVSQYEVSMRDYFLFMTESRFRGPAGFAKTMPDTLAMNPKTIPYLRAYLNFIGDENNDNGPGFANLIQFYGHTSKPYFLFNPELDKNKIWKLLGQMPINGISHEQAVLFTQWMSQLYNEELMLDEDVRVRFRLPTTAEWEEMATQALRDDMKKKQLWDSINPKNCFLYNYNMLNTCSGYESFIQKFQGKGLATVDAFYPAMNGTFNVFGNVSEMVAEKGISKGGNYTVYANQCRIPLSQNYTKPEPWLGFRWVLEIIEFRN
ncbi:MAG: SUMF1/EgtB/PvdO family nonheme iron enzyme [Flavobacteriales bacterium]